MVKALENHFTISPQNSHGKVQFIDMKEKEAVKTWTPIPLRDMLFKEDTDVEKLCSLYDLQHQKL